ncbi:hypothetical protein ACIRL0_30490 [Streptomyces sp. NPDC102365]|uniref:hypothetical protein n=1 Tax=Streptomyces sp. NPDC102365 TaxID=3366162 RepID=UPI0038231B08
MARIVLGRVNIRSMPHLKRDSHPGHLPHIRRRRETRDHRLTFEYLVDVLEGHRIEYATPSHDDRIQEALKLASSVLDERKPRVYQTTTGQTFAMDLQDNWISMTVPEGGRPQLVSTDISRFLQAAAPAIKEKDLSIDVDLVCHPGRIINGIGQLVQVAELSLTVRLPNPGCDLPDALRRMEECGARIAEEKYANERGLAVPFQEAERFDKEASRGNVDVKAISTNGEIFDSKENPAEFEPSFQIVHDIVPSALVLALAWLIERWSGGGGPT